MDQLTASALVRDSSDDSLRHCPASITLAPNAGTLALSSCGPLSVAGITDLNGTFQCTFSRIGGRGSLDVRISVFCCGSLELARILVNFTSPDLDANGTVNIIDLGLWADGLPPGYLQTSDYDCNHAVNIIDLGVWAGGLGLGCGSAPSR